MSCFTGFSSRRVLALIVLAAASSARANITYWSADPATPDDWFDAFAWSEGLPNNSSLAAYIANGGTATISYGTAYTEGIFVGANNMNNIGSSGTLLLSAGQLSCGSYGLYVGYGNGTSRTEGLVDQSGGAATASNLSIADSTYSSGTYELSGNAQLEIAGAETIGYSSLSNAGMGQFIQTGGVNTMGTLAVQNGSYQFDAGLITAQELALASSGAATFTQTGGTIDLTNGNIALAIATSGGSATYTITGGTLTAYGTANIGSTIVPSSGYTLFSQTNSTCSFDYLVTGFASTYLLNANSQLNAFSETIQSVFVQDGGINTINGINANSNSLTVGAFNNSTSSYSLLSGQLLTIGNEMIGGETTALFTQSGGLNDTSKTLNISNGDYVLTGGTLLAQTETIEPGLFNQTGGSNTVSTLSIYSSSAYNLLSGILQVTHSFSNSGTFDLQNPASAGLSGTSILTLAPLAITGTGTLEVEQNAALYAGSITQGALIIGGKIQIAPQSQTSKINSLDITTGILDITDNELIIDYPSNGPTPLPSIRGYLHSGYANNWTGSGIVSSVAAGDMAVGIGYAENSDLGLATFGGVTVDSTAILLRYTWVGDANLDGVVNAADLAMIQANGTTWDTGDFNYDGVVNADDYALFDLGAAVSGGNAIPLPEPGAGLLFAIPLILGGIRRRTSIGKAMV